MFRNSYGAKFTDINRRNVYLDCCVGVYLHTHKHIHVKTNSSELSDKLNKHYYKSASAV